MTVSLSHLHPLAAAATAGERRDSRIRVDLQLIADMIAPQSRVLDVGCGDGALLDYLVHYKQVDGRGIEISQTGVNACVSLGLPVIQGDADQDLGQYPANSFDYVILSQTLQATLEPRDASTPVAFDPCRPVHYVVNPQGAPDDGAELVRTAIADLSTATGLHFVDDGSTTERPDKQRDAYQPERYSPNRWAPVLIAWSDEQEFPGLAGYLAGIAGPSTVYSASGKSVSRA